MPATLTTIRYAVLALALAAGSAAAQNLAPDFTGLPKGAKVAMMPSDVELFSLSAGGVPEPKADWTEAAIRNLKTALHARKAALGVDIADMSVEDGDALAEINTLHAAVANAISLHQFSGAVWNLPTKDKKLDWKLGEAVAAIKQRTGADYALFSYVRDSYASAERKAAMVALALVGVGLHGGAQVGYASLVDLNTGRVLWFNKILRATGDMRDEDGARETLNSLLDHFPAKAP
ncbi:MAG: hypothetical protein V4463_10000 [Pseudomonadota bacterium]